MSREVGERLASEGQDRALSKAEDDHAHWIAAATCTFIHMLKSGPATIDEALKDIPRPEGMHPNVIGGIVGRLSRAKVIMMVDTRTAESSSRHAGLNRVWALVPQEEV